MNRQSHPLYSRRYRRYLRLSGKPKMSGYRVRRNNCRQILFYQRGEYQRGVKGDSELKLSRRTFGRKWLAHIQSQPLPGFKM